MRKVFISDQSIEKLEKDRGRALLFREKTATASMLDGIGADAVELPAVRSFKEDRIVCSTIAKSLKNAAAVIGCGASAGSVREAWECVKDARRPVLKVSLPVSTVQMEYFFHMKGPKMLETVEALCKEASALCPETEFEARDASRAERGFLAEVLKTAEGAGASFVTVCDDAGLCLPDEAAELVRLAKDAVGVPVFFSTTDKLGMGLACAAAALGAGADGLKTSVGGKESLCIQQLSDLIRARGFDLGLSCGLDPARIHSDAADLERKLSGEVYAPSVPASEKKGSEIMLSSSCTLPQVAEAAVSLGYELSDEDCGRVYDALSQIFERRTFAEGRELEAIIASYAMQVPSTYHLNNYVINAGSATGAMASISLVRDGEEIAAVARGDGPIDAAFMAMEQAVGHQYELDDFQVQAVTEGKDSLGSTVIRLRSGGKLYSGNGLSTDIVGASIRAYINALNKIVYDENRQ